MDTVVVFLISVEFVVLFTDYQYLVNLECRDIGVNDSCDLQNGYIAMYARSPVDVTSIIPDLIRIVRLENCFQANDFVSVSHDGQRFLFLFTVLLLRHGICTTVD